MSRSNATNGRVMPLFASPGDIRDDASKNDPFAKWCEDAELFPTTVHKLQESGFVTLKSVQYLTLQMIEQEFPDLKLAQKLLLDSAIAELNNACAQKTETESEILNRKKNEGTRAEGNERRDLQHKLDSGSNLSVQDLLALWNQPDKPQTPATQQSEQNVAGKALVFDPFAQPVDAANSLTHRNICDYISLATQDRRKEHSGGLAMGDFELSLSDGKVSLNNKKVELGRVTQSQYMEASLKILREMVYKDKISVSQIMDYVGYLTKIATLAQTFQWTSVLLYDREYRKEQSDKGFSWGADNSYLMQLLLRPMGQMNTGVQNNVNRSQSTGKQRSTFEPSTGRPICEKWNSRWGCTLKNCRYAHVCHSCYSPSHTDMTHSTSTHKPTAGGNHDTQGNGSRSDSRQNYTQAEGPKNCWG
jgi:hypothetical protein